MAALGMLDRMLDIDPELDQRYPGLEARMRFYHPLLSGMVRVVVVLATLVLLAQFWGFGGLEWIGASALGQRMVSALLTIGVTVLAAVAAWEAVNTTVQRHLANLQREAQAARSARLRTLLPMLRTVLMITILLVVALMVLSEIGVNIAPLLAGAGVLGIAIGFGSQKLVQDVITGLFLLLENTMQVGDVVTLGGLTGVVEHLSIRTIRLRAEDGSLHVIPFSAVTTVTNMTRDFAHAVVETQVTYKDDYDKVVEVLRQIVREMRVEPRWQNEIRDELEVMGLQRFADTGVIIKCRIRCGPFGRWSVGREFNRRMKLAFDANGIEMPFVRPGGTV
jgi:small-conductance mechanosensitive channel